MKATSVILILALALSASAETIRFDNMKIGRPPRGWLAAETGIGHAVWTVEKDDTSPGHPKVLRQSGEAEYPLCAKQDTKIEDGFVEVKFKAISGKEDEAAGVIFRCKDKDDYYIVRANALEDNLIFFHMIKGHRESIKTVGLTTTPNEWHTLRVAFTGTHFTATYDGKQVMEAEDDAISGPGMVGVWTKADSVTAFDDFTFTKEK